MIPQTKNIFSVCRSLNKYRSEIRNGVVALTAIYLLMLSACQKHDKQEPYLELPLVSTQTLSDSNPTSREFPGGRGADELILYTAAFGDSTGTNKYGTEAIVVDGQVIAVGGNNSAIPGNGFVLSGHGDMSSWISANLQPGHFVTVEDALVRVSRTHQSELFLAGQLLEDALANLERFPNRDRMSSFESYRKRSKRLSGNALAIAKQNRPGGDSSALAEAENARKEAQKAYYSSFPSQDTELRACWYVIKESSPGEIDQNIRKFAEIGFNAICPQIIYSGYAVYPDAHPDLAQNPAFAGWDPLAALVTACKKYNVKLIPWVWTYYVGRAQSPLVASKKDWLAESWRGEYGSRMEIDYHFFCPSRPEVEDFWLDVYRSMLARYDIDGLQLDYIRYPVSEPWENGYCYCPICRKKFEDRHGRDPHTLTPDDATLWQSWNDYRIEQITRFVGRVRKLVDEVKPELDLSADVFPTPSESLVNKQQDWGQWLKNGYLDELFIMSYTHDVNSVVREAEELRMHTAGNSSGYVGLAPFMGLTSEALLEQILAAQEAGTQGITFFHYGSLTKEHLEALKLGPFRQKAKLPGRQ